jgi:hypothetical protein
MKFFAVILFVALFSTGARLHLAADLKRDYKIMNEHGVYIDPHDKKEVHRLDKYARIDLSKFMFSNKQIGKHVISKWKSPTSALTIWQVETTINVDTVYQEQSILIDSLEKQEKLKGKTYRIKGKFSFRIYVINDTHKSQMVYTTDLKDGMIEFRYGNKRIAPAYESIALGRPYPNPEEILVLTR